jgi:sugar/nucleoside kinase (ribokinase family)
MEHDSLSLTLHYLIVNEIEAGALVGIEPNSENLTEIAVKLKNLGVIERVIIHTPVEAICASNSGVTKVKSYKLPKNFIVGTTGAGDAFCAGALYGIYQDKTDKDILEFVI